MASRRKSESLSRSKLLAGFFLDWSAETSQVAPEARKPRAISSRRLAQRKTAVWQDLPAGSGRRDLRGALRVFKFASLRETNQFHGSAVPHHPSGAVRPEIPDEFSHSQESCQETPGLVNPLHWRSRCRCSASSVAIGTDRRLARSPAAGERLSVTDSRVTEGDFPAGQRGGLGLAGIPPPSPPHPRSPGAGGPREHPADRPARARSASSGRSSRKCQTAWARLHELEPAALRAGPGSPQRSQPAKATGAARRRASSTERGVVPAPARVLDTDGWRGQVVPAEASTPVPSAPYGRSNRGRTGRLGPGACGER
jgi:hypothetical protein